MEVFEIILTFLAEISWPVSVFLIFCLAVYAIKQGWIGSIKAWNASGGLEVAKAEDDFAKRAKETLEKPVSLEEKLEELRVDFREATNDMTKPERGSNSNGEYWIYANGMAGARVIIPADQLKRECHLVFPVAFANDNILVTFSGQVVPTIRKLSKHGVDISIEGDSAADIVMSVLGPRSAPD